MKKFRSIKKFLGVESAAGVVLAVATVLALIFANSGLSEAYFGVINLKVFNLSLQHWINDGLMVLFFFVVGLEIKKEIVAGELSTFKKASFPIAGAIGGMLVPAIIYLFFNRSAPESNGWGIPMATDIAFAVSVLTLFSSRVPFSLKIFLLALAIVDDLGAILVIAIFYSSTIKLTYLALAALAFAAVLGLQQLRVKSYLAYFAIGLIAWVGILLSGVHATIAGVVLGLMTPLQFSFGQNRHVTYSPLEELLHALHPWVSFFIMPIFAFANAGISLAGMDLLEVAKHGVSNGVFWGLVVGKPLGIFLLAFVLVKLKVATLPSAVKWGQVLAVACLAGMGFTMSLFISSLALPADLEIYSKSAILLGSIVAGLIGILALHVALPKEQQVLPV